MPFPNRKVNLSGRFLLAGFREEAKVAQDQVHLQKSDFSPGTKAPSNFRRETDSKEKYYKGTHLLNRGFINKMSEAKCCGVFLMTLLKVSFWWYVEKSMSTCTKSALKTRVFPKTYGDIGRTKERGPLRFHPDAQICMKEAIKACTGIQGSRWFYRPR